MSFSFKIGNVFGIPIRIHATFLLLVYVLAAFAGEPEPDAGVVLGPLAVLGLTAMSFGCVLLHELGHCLVARSFGLRVADITLWPLGGIARMSEIPENSRIEGLIAIAGPAVNFALAGLGILALLGGYALGLEAGSTLHLVLLGFTLANFVQGGFNLLPAFPMDGGRLLRAFLARKRDWLAATESAVRTGRLVAFLLLLASVASMRHLGSSACALPLIALFVWFEGTRELWSVRVRHGVLPFGANFRFGAEPAPAAPREAAPSAEASERGVAQRPQSWQQREQKAGGFNEDELRWLEAYRGPLRRPPEDS